MPMCRPKNLFKTSFDILTENQINQNTHINSNSIIINIADNLNKLSAKRKEDEKK